MEGKYSVMAASCPVKKHLWRGFFGLGLLVVAGFVYSANGWAALALVAVAAVFLRGCPVCWSFWLYEAVRDKKRLPASPADDPQA